MVETSTPVALTAAAVEERVLQIVRGLATELGGARAESAVSPECSLERDVGLGSLERVELLVRLEAAFRRPLDDRFITFDTPAALARALCEGGGEGLSAELDQAPVLAPAARIEGAAETLSELLWRRAENDADRPHVFLRDDSGAEQVIPYGELLHDARAVAGGLRDRGVRKGDTVAIMLPTSRDFLTTFQGIQLSGGIPVPIYPPARLDQLEEYARRQSAILADAGAVVMVTLPRAKPIAAMLQPLAPALRDVVSVSELTAARLSWPAPTGNASDPALIQYTSGSTGHPKGVLLTHANLMANIEAIGAGVHVRPTDVGVSWLPLYHDMGLIGTWLFCLVHGIPLDIQSPLAFLSRPERWLWAIHKRRATLSPAPNFAYELCVRKISDSALEGLDLSSWRCALNGAEPVNPDTLDRFARRFARYGFRREAFLPVYGLAECSVALCFPPVNRVPAIDHVARDGFEREGRAEPVDRDDPRALRFVSVGGALPRHEVRLADESGRDVPDRTVGRLIFRGPSMMTGYYRKPEETAAITVDGGWLDSGDLAYRANEEIFIAGRLKDLIIKGGRNLVPQEIEQVAASVDGVRRGCVVAFGVDHPTLGTESLVIVAETRAKDQAERNRIAAAVTASVAGAVGLPPDDVVLVPPGAVPKTSSGKIRRAATKEQYVRGELGACARTPFLKRLRVVVAAAWGEVAPSLARIGGVIYGAYLAAILVPTSLAAWVMAIMIPGRKPLFLIQRFGSRIALLLSGCRLTVEGLENLSGSGPLLAAVNHASYVDIPALLALIPRDFVFVGKKEVHGWPVVGTFVRRCGHLMVERRVYRQSILDSRRVASALEAGESVVGFPEGTFTAAAGLRPFRLGLFKTAVETGVPIVPMALTGTRHVLRSGRLIPSPGRIHLWVGRQVAPEGSGWHAIVSLRDRAAAEIAAHCAEPVLDMVGGGAPSE